MIDTIMKIFDLLKELLEHREAKRGELYETHVQPLFEQMCNIHQDYITICDEVVDKLKNPKTRPSEIKEFARKRAASLGHMRQVVGDLARELMKIDGFSESDPVSLFAQSVIFYLLTPTGLPPELESGTRFEMMLEILSLLSRGKIERSTALKEISRMRDFLLEVWKNFSEHYARAKMYCLT